MYDGAERTFEEGVEEYILDMKARNLRDGTINHYRQSTKQIYKRVPPETAISSFSKKTIDDFYVALREDKNLNDVSMGTYASFFTGVDSFGEIPFNNCLLIDAR